MRSAVTTDITEAPNYVLINSAASAPFDACVGWHHGGTINPVVP